jgi:ketosteroid isomerase-like protein
VKVKRDRGKRKTEALRLTGGAQIKENPGIRARYQTMPKAKTQAAVVGGSADDIEAAFYEALQTGDIDKLMACWADEDDMVCVHPGGPRVIGVAAIRSAFDAMFTNGSIRAWPVHVRKVESLASVVHNVLERIEILTEAGPREAYVVATNVYHKTAQGWRMVVHHASPGTESEVQEISHTPQVLH